MTDQTHTERATDWLALELGDGWSRAEEIIDLLKSDPALLFDLALEAGALEQKAIGWRTVKGYRVRLWYPGEVPSEFAERPDPLYRRVEPTGEAK